MDASKADPAVTLAAAESILDNFRVLLVASRPVFDEQDRRVLARELRQRVANECAAVSWALLGQLSSVDEEVLRVLCELEPARGLLFRTTGSAIFERARGVSFSIVYVALRRLTALGLIDRISHQGRKGTLVRVRHTGFELVHAEAA